MNKLIVAIFIFIFFTGIYVNGYFLFNTSDGAFNPNPGSSEMNEVSSNYLGQLVIEGAGFFLQSNSDYQLFLKKVELSGIVEVNTNEILEVLDKAVKNMELAKQTYEQLLQLTAALEYNPTARERLRDFDYSGYCKKNRLNRPVFRQVEKLLKAGDVRGCYQRCYNAVGVILDKLNDIKTVVESGNLPVIPACWRLNQLYLETGLFGQYASEVFMNLE